MSDLVKSDASAALIEKVILQNDLSGLTPIEKVQHVKNICDSLGLNPLTKPIAILKFQGKEVPYITRDGAEQLRKLNKVSITDIKTQMLDGDIYVVTAHAETPDGRKDTSTGVKSVAGLRGEALSNGLMTAETKAKRRVTLSICGLGFMSEEEAESIPDSVKVEVVDPHEEQALSEIEIIVNDMELCNDINVLKDMFLTAVERYKGNAPALDIISSVKDRRKAELTKPAAK